MINLTSVKLKTFPPTNTVKKAKRQATDWEKIFIVQIPDKEIYRISRTYKELLLIKKENDKTPHTHKTGKKKLKGTSQKRISK